MNEEANATSRPGLKSVLLGLFVLFQLIYLPLSNLMQLVPREMPEHRGELDIRVQREGTATNQRSIQEAINGLGTCLDRYGELSGQVQAWSLFAPDFGTQTIYPIAEFEFGEGQERFLMRNEPLVLRADPERYLRWPGPNSRLVGSEFLLGVVYWRFSEESLQQRGPEWQKAVREHVRRQQKSLEAWFRLNLAMLKRTHPNLPEPKAGILRVWIHPSPEPGERERPPAFTMPLARWIPGRDPHDRNLPIDAYDPVTKEFVALQRDQLQ